MENILTVFRQALSSAPGSFFLTSLISLFLGNSPGTLLESTKLLASVSLQLEIHNVLCEANQKIPEEQIWCVLVWLSSFWAVHSSANTETRDLKSHQQWRQAAYFPQGHVFWWKEFPFSSVPRSFPLSNLLTRTHQVSKLSRMAIDTKTGQGSRKPIQENICNFLHFWNLL